MPKSKHGGSRPVRRKKDGRLKRKVKKSTKTSLTFETDDLDWLKETYGSNPHVHNWGDVVRGLIRKHREEIENG